MQLAVRTGLSALAITDHDYYSGSYDAVEMGRRMGLRVIPGVECSTYDHGRGHKVHILCYNCKHPDAIEELLRKATAYRTENVLASLKKVAQIYPITEEMVMDGVSESGFIGKQHILLALMKAGYANEIYGDLYRKLFNRRNGTCLTPGRWVDTFEAMDYLRQSGGVIVLAHPSVYGSITSMEDLIRAGIHGVEINHPRNTQEHREIIVAAAEKHGLLLTGGTDFHGYFAEKEQLFPLGHCTASDGMLAKFDELSAGLV